MPSGGDEGVVGDEVNGEAMLMLGSQVPPFPFGERAFGGAVFLLELILGRYIERSWLLIGGLVAIP